jgi:hypothetical protein
VVSVWRACHGEWRGVREAKRRIEEANEGQRLNV